MNTWIGQFVRALFPYSLKSTRIEKAYLVKHPHIPKSLYKYRCFTASHLQAFEAGELWFSSPDSFNDLLDSAVNFDPDNLYVENLTGEELEEEIRAMKNAGKHGEDWQPRALSNPILSRAWLENRIEEIAAGATEIEKIQIQSLLPELREFSNNLIVEASSGGFRRSLAVLSLSETPLNHLMWAHYSENNQGFCIEYDFELLEPTDLLRRLCYPVLYRKRLCNITRYLQKGIQDQNIFFGQYLCMQKQRPWSYEREWRVILSIGPSHTNFAQTMPTPKSVILGAKVSEQNRKKMLSLCVARKINVKEVVVDTRTGELKIR